MSATDLCPCAIPADSQAPRCNVCPHFAGTGATRPVVRAPASAGIPVLMRYSRWEKSTGTFGPVGRVVATVLLLVPLPVLAIGASVGIGLIGGGIYLLVIMPWALKDIWKRAAIPVQAPPLPGAAPSAHRFQADRF